MFESPAGNAGSHADGAWADGPDLWGPADADGPGDIRRADAGALK